MSSIKKFGLLYPNKKPKLNPFIEKVKDEVVQDIYLESDAETISTVNTNAAYKNKLIHDIADYRRTDQTLLLLPPIQVALDHLLIFKEEEL